MIRSTTIPALPAHERPRERLATLGAGALSDAELVAIQLGTGGRGESAVALGRALLAEWGGVAGLARAAVDELARRRGVGPAKAARIVAAFALADRLAGPESTWYFWAWWLYPIRTACAEVKYPAWSKARAINRRRRSWRGPGTLGQ